MRPKLVIERARAKVNLALHIVGRRLDGYHELDSIVAFADVADSLTITAADQLALTVSGPFDGMVPTDRTNSVLKTWQSLSDHQMRQGKLLPPLAFHLEKNLPVSSGIGGGSADAAAALRGIIQFCDLVIAQDELGALALKLGADVPVCLAQQRCRMRGIGDVLEKHDHVFPPAIVLVNPRRPASTANIFEILGLQRGEAVNGNAVADFWRNDLTQAAIKAVPQIATVIQALEVQPTLSHVRMSGSGATCFGLAESLESAASAADVIKKNYPAWWVVATTLA
jgi:4-diphosphocytidyl-2-C-methyl-D-erythritol kinase